jgi:hypothetical protein
MDETWVHRVTPDSKHNLQMMEASLVIHPTPPPLKEKDYLAL